MATHYTLIMTTDPVGGVGQTLTYTDGEVDTDPRRLPIAQITYGRPGEDSVNDLIGYWSVAASDPTTVTPINATEEN